MGKFSDPNYDLLQRYFNIIGSRQTGTQLSYIAGPKRGIWANGGAFTVLYENNPTKGFVGHTFLIKSIDGNRFMMEYKGVYRKFKKYRTPAETQEYTDFDVGNEMYFRKDSFFHEWLARSDNEAYRNYVNQDRTYCFFGKIWSGGNRDNPNLYAIEFEGLKDFAIKAIPPHNATPDVQEWLNVYFDQVHHEPYTMLKTLWSLLDAREIDMRWLSYIAQIYGIEINDDYAELNLREWVENLIYFLKRIGTFNALYVVWKLYLTNTINAVNIYERWDEWCQPNIWAKDSMTLANVSGFDRFPGFHPGLPAGVRSYFGPEIYPIHDYNWLEFYGQQPSGGSGDLWYSQFNPDKYPTHAQEAPSAACNALNWSCGPAESFTCYDARDMGSTISSITTFSVGLSAYPTVDSSTATLSLSGQFISGDFEHCAGVTMSNLTTSNCSFIFYGLSNDFAGFGSDTGNWIGVAFERLGPTSRRFAIYEQYGGTIYSSIGTETSYQNSIRYRVGIDRDCTANTVTVYIYDGKRREENLVETIVHTLNGCPDYTFLHAANGITNGLDGEFNGTIWRQHIDLSTLTWSVGPTGNPVITPHYLVEVDLNSEPLIDVNPFDILFEGQDFIINKFIADELVRNWEYVRPVNKHVLYQELLSPPAKEERVATSVPLYPLDSNGYFNTFYTGSRFLSAGAPTPSAGVATYLHIQKESKKTWNITHDLNSRYNVVQVWENIEGSACRQTGKIARRIEPNNIFIIDENNLQIVFNSAVNGWATIAGEAWLLTYSHFEETQCTPGIWTVFHDFEDTPFGGLEGYPSGVGPLVNVWLHEVSSSSSSTSSSSFSSSSSESSSSLSSSSSESSSSSSSSSSESSSSSVSSSSSSSSSLSSSSSSSISSSVSICPSATCGEYPKLTLQLLDSDTKGTGYNDVWGETDELGQKYVFIADSGVLRSYSVSADGTLTFIDSVSAAPLQSFSSIWGNDSTVFGGHLFASVAGPSAGIYSYSKSFGIMNLATANIGVIGSQLHGDSNFMYGISPSGLTSYVTSGPLGVVSVVDAALPLSGGADSNCWTDGNRTNGNGRVYTVGANHVRVYNVAIDGTLTFVDQARAGTQSPSVGLRAVWADDRFVYAAGNDNVPYRIGLSTWSIDVSGNLTWHDNENAFIGQGGGGGTDADHRDIVGIPGCYVYCVAQGHGLIRYYTDNTNFKGEVVYSGDHYDGFDFAYYDVWTDNDFLYLTCENFGGTPGLRVIALSCSSSSFSSSSESSSSSSSESSSSSSSSLSTGGADNFFDNTYWSPYLATYAIWDAGNSEWDHNGGSPAPHFVALAPIGGWFSGYTKNFVDITVDNITGGSGNMTFTLQGGGGSSATASSIPMTNGSTYTLDISGVNADFQALLTQQVNTSKTHSITNIVFYD